MSVAIGLFLLRATVVLATATLLDGLLWRAPAVQRHRLWTATFLALLALPALSAVLPALPAPAPLTTVFALFEVEPRTEPRVPVTDAAGRPRASTTAVEASTSGPPDGRDRGGEAAPIRDTGVTTAPIAAATWPESLRGVALAVWIAGVLVALFALARAHWRARSLCRTAIHPVAPGWRRLCHQLAMRLGLRRHVALASSDRVHTPMAGGVLRPVVLLPAGSRGWDRERARVVMAHELVHHAHHDPLRHLLARAALTLLWFHPLAWWAGRQAVLAREQACDERVLRLGTRPSCYARHLLELAETLTLPDPSPVTALPMIQRSLLETRLMAILKPRHTRHTLPLALACAFLLTATTLAAAATSVQPPLPAAPPTAGTEPIAELPTGSTTPGVPGQASESPASACHWPDRHARFSGTISSRDDGGRVDRWGWGDGRRVLQTSVEGMRLCAQSDNDSEWQDASWSDAMAEGTLLLEVRSGTGTHAMQVVDGQIRSFTVDGDQRPIDDAARAWRDSALAVADQLWEISQVRGRVSSLRGRISSVRGQESSLRGRISSLRGQVSSMRGEISSARGRASSLRGRISSLRGHVSSLRGQISSERGEISSLRSALRVVSEEERGRLQERMEASEARIRELEQEIEEFDLETQVAEVERELAQLDIEEDIRRTEQEIAEFDLETRVREVEQEIAQLDVEGKVADLQRQIEALDADRRVQEAQARLDELAVELARRVREIR